MANPIYKVEILDNQRQPITHAKRLIEFNKEGHILRYSGKLSDSGFAKFRLAADDPMFATFGDIIKPMKNHIRIYRGNKKVWQGIITQNPHKRSNYYDISAQKYIYRFKKLLAKRDPEVTPGDGLNNYRTFKTGTMALAVTGLLSEAKTIATANDPIQLVTAGTIENPNFPPYFTNSAGAALSGGWTFSDDIAVQVDYKSIFYLISVFGAYANCDFELTDDFIFNFKKFIGTRRPQMVFEYNENNAYGSIDDFDVPEDGQNMVNDIWGIAVDNEGKIIHINKRDEASIGEYLLNQDVAAFSDLKDKNSLQTRLNETIRYTAYPDGAINTVLNSRAIPFGTYDLGDSATFRIKSGIIDFEEERRITGYSVSVHNTGKEIIILESNKLREDQL